MLKRHRSGVHLRSIVLKGFSLQALLLFACTLVGVLFGYLAARSCAARVGGELADYLHGYLLLEEAPSLDVQTAGQTLACYFRAPVLVFMAGFASIGIFLIPVVCAAQGFLFSFSFCAFSAALGRSDFLLLLFLFGVRLLLVLPWTAAIGCAALRTSSALAALSFRGGARVKQTPAEPCWRRFGVAALCLFLGAMAELCLFPHILPLLRR